MAIQSKITTIIDNADEITVRELTETELAEIESEQTRLANELKKTKSDAAAQAKAKDELLVKLGISAAEAKLLLS